MGAAPIERPIATPMWEPAMTGLIGRVGRRQVFPGCAFSKDPQYAVQGVWRIAPRAAKTVRTNFRIGKKRFDERPLRFSERGGNAGN